MQLPGSFDGFSFDSVLFGLLVISENWKDWGKSSGTCYLMCIPYTYIFCNLSQLSWIYSTNNLANPIQMRQNARVPLDDHHWWRVLPVAWEYAIHTRWLNSRAKSNDWRLDNQDTVFTYVCMYVCMSNVKWFMRVQSAWNKPCSFKE